MNQLDITMIKMELELSWFRTMMKRMRFMKRILNHKLNHSIKGFKIKLTHNKEQNQQYIKNNK